MPATPGDPASAESEQQRLARVEVEFAKAQRLNFFSDAVVAIAITLLGLQLPVPTGGSNQQVLQFVGEHFDDYLAFLISFMVIGAHWQLHHHVFGCLDRLGSRLTRFNILWLFLIVVTPFATRVLTGDGGFLVRFGFYALVQALLSAVFVLMVREMERGRLTRAGTPSDLFAQSYWRSGTLVVAFAVSIPVSLLGQWAFICWIAIPLGVYRGRMLYERGADLWHSRQALPRPSARLWYPLRAVPRALALRWPGRRRGARRPRRG